MDQARYLPEDKDEAIIVDASKITPKQNEEIYRGNLYCEYPDCDARLVYNERQKGKFLRYFSTLRGSNHKPGCPNEIFHDGKRGPIIHTEGEDVNVSDKHIQDVLDEAYKQFYNKLHPSENEENNDKKHKKKKKKKKPVTMQDNDEAATVQKDGTPVTTGEGKTIIEGKEPYIYKREIGEVQEKDKNTTKEIHGIVDKMRILENEAYIDLAGLDGSKFSVYIGNPFKVNCEQEFNLLHYFDKYIKKQKEENKLIICTTVGEITEQQGLNVVQIYHYRHIKLDRLGFYQVVNFINNFWNKE